jgi:glutathione S-transferase
MVGYGTYEAAMNAAEKAISGGPYIAGDAFTAIDDALAA